MKSQKITPDKIIQLQKLVQTGFYAQAQTELKAYLKKCPQHLGLWNLLGVCQQAQGEYQAAIFSFERIRALNAQIPEVYFNLASLYTQIQSFDLSIENYKKALHYNPHFTMAHFNLAALYQGQQQIDKAADHYTQAIQLQANFVEALVNLGTIRQQQGKLQDAKTYYEQALHWRDDAQSQFNLGTVLHDLGEHQAAMVAFERCLVHQSDFEDAWNNLGETYRDAGNMIDAVRCYQKTLEIAPQHSRALYNLGEYYCLTNELTKAIPYFDASTFSDAKERSLQCLYKTQQFDRFKAAFDKLIEKQPHTSVLLSALSAHYAHSFGVVDPYTFCPNPMQWVQQTSIEELAAPQSTLRTQLLTDIAQLAISERKQGRLYFGIQSAGNLLQRSEASFQTLAALIREQIYAYRQHYQTVDCQLIHYFPDVIEFSSSWYLQMNKGGYLTSHIHEEGWISGCVYLQLPDKKSTHEGSFEYGIHGDDYPHRQQVNFPFCIVDQSVGDIVLFPSSLFHRTHPFYSDEQRVCIAFDVKPTTNLH